ncbi:MAG: S-layer homology domain-containing protein [Clostridia bacterium]|nr:S-layer homology domain-containing protein [Clostridia bacterium]
MIKKITISVIIGMLSAGTAASADNLLIAANGKNVEVSADISENTRASMFVVKDTYQITDVDYIYAVKEAISDSNGKISFDFVMPDEKNGMTCDGIYNVYVKAENSEDEIEKFAYASPETKEQLKAAVDADGFETELAKTENAVAFKAMGMNVDLYYSLDDTNQAEVIAMLGNVTGANLESSVSSFNLCTAAAAINGASNDNEISEFIKNTDLKFQSTLYSEISDAALKVWIDKGIYTGRRYKNAQELADRYEEVNILYIINNTRFGNMDSVLAQYADELGIKSNDVYIEYLGLSSKGTVNQKIVSALANAPVTDTNALISVIKNAMGTNDTGGGGSSGGGSSKSSSSGSKKTAGMEIISTSEVVTKSEFNDIKEASWAKEAINALDAKKIVSGDGDGNFRPNAPVKREEFVKMIVNAVKLYNKNAACDFLDVDKNEWYYPYIASAHDNKIINGISETEFGIGSILTRQDMAVICYRTAKERKDFLKNRDVIEFADAESISEYAVEAVSELYTASYIEGMEDNKFEPLGIATRAQAAQMLYNLFLKE